MIKNSDQHGTYSVLLQTDLLKGHQASLTFLTPYQLSSLPISANTAALAKAVSCH